MRHSKGDYPENWDEIASQTKEAADWKCIRCGAVHSPVNGYSLTVHHMDMDPSNNRWWNLLALCQRCHLHVQGKVILEQIWMFDHSDWIKPYVAGYYAYLQGLSDNREYIDNHLSDLLLLGRKSAVNE
jgi:5-methylcytosine-specific restriction endonuclease McrA